MNLPTTPRWGSNPDARFRFTALALLTAALVWLLAPLLGPLAAVWQASPHYAHGPVVPLLALWLVWQRHDADMPMQRRPLFGVMCIGIGAVLFVTGWRAFGETAALWTSIGMLWGIVCLVGGRSLLTVYAPAVAYLLFAVPLPWRVEQPVMLALQHTATVTAAFLAQLLGWQAVAVGNVIHIQQQQVGVAEACSGIRILLTLFAITTAGLLMTRRSTSRIVFILLLVVPVALLTNTLRILVVTLAVGSSAVPVHVERLHTIAGWCMMPLGLALLVGADWLCGWNATKAATPDNSDFPHDNSISPQNAPAPGRREYVCVALASGLILWAGWYSRIGLAQAGSSVSVARPLHELPVLIGDWQGEDVRVSAADLQRGGIEESLQRRYRHRVSGAVVSLVIVAGPAGPLSVHSPTSCFQGLGYHADAPPQTVTLGADEFFRATFSQPNMAAASPPLQTHWAWRGDGRWVAAQSPRWLFAGRARLCKIYVTQSIIEDVDDASPSAGRQFLQQAQPLLQQLFDGPQSLPQDEMNTF